MKLDLFRSEKTEDTQEYLYYYIYSRRAGIFSRGRISVTEVVKQGGTPAYCKLDTDNIFDYNTFYFSDLDRVLDYPKDGDKLKLFTLVDNDVDANNQFEAYLQRWKAKY